MSEQWTLVLPFRGDRRGKSRLAATLSDPGPAYPLAVAMLFDVATAALATDEVGRVVLLSGGLPDLPAPLRTDRRLVEVRQRVDGLNEALSAWLEGAGDARVAVVQPDLPALTAPVLAAVLRDAGRLLAAGSTTVVVPDAAGTGTAMLAGPASALRPAFGADSARRHVEGGATRLDPGQARLQVDVDTASDLRRAVRLGLGPYTTAALDDGGSVALRG